MNTFFFFFFSLKHYCLVKCFLKKYFQVWVIFWSDMRGSQCKIDSWAGEPIVVMNNDLVRVKFWIMYKLYYKLMSVQIYNKPWNTHIFYFFSPPKKITCEILSLFGIILKNSNMFFYPVLPWHKVVKNKNHNLITVICFMRNWPHARTYKISFAYADSTAAKVVSSVEEVLSRSSCP